MLSKFSVKKPYTIVVAVVLVIILGVVSFTSMTIDLLPSMNMPYAIVMTTYVGASPEEVEEVVTKPTESAMATLSNISNVSSISQENASVVVLEFEEAANMDSATIEMRESLDRISAYWPDTVGSPMIMRINPDMLPVMVAAVTTGGDDIAQASTDIEDNIIPELERIEGVASVSASGSVEETIEVAVDADLVKQVNKKVKKTLDEKFEEATKALEKAQAELKKGKKELESGQKKAATGFGSAEAEVSKNEAKMQIGLLEINEKLRELDVAEATLDKETSAALPQLEATEADLTAKKEGLALLKQNESAITAGYQQVLGAIAAYGETPELLEQKKNLEAQIAQLEQYDSLVEKLDSGLEQVKTAKAKLTEGKKQIEDGRKVLKDTKKQLEEGLISLAEAREKMTTTQVETILQMSSANTQLALGESQLQTQQNQFDETKDTAYESADLKKILTVDMVKTILTAQNFNMPAGYVKEDNVDYLIRVGEKFKTIEDLKNLVLVNMEGVDPITLSDVASVKKVDDSDEVYAKMNGKSGLVLSIQKQTGYSTGDVSKRLLSTMEELEKENEGVEIVTLMDQGVYIDLIVNSVLQNLLLGAVLAVLILLVFLRDLKPTLIIACSIPISLMAAIVLMYFSGVTLNVISLSGLALGVGMLVDNSIVVIENIYRMRNEEGADVKTAAIEGAKEVAGAIFASTLTTVCVFAPIIFVQGLTKQLFVDMALTIAYSLLASLVVALTLVPMMAAGMLKKPAKSEGKGFAKIQGLYGRMIRWSLGHKAIVLVLAIVLLVSSTLLAVSRGTAFMPEMESPQISMTVTTEEGTTFEDTTKVADDVMDALMKIPDIADVGAMASSGNVMSMMGGGSGENAISVYAILKENPQMSNKELQARIENDTKDLPCELELSMSSMDMSALGSSGIVVQIEGRELDVLQQTAKEVAAIVEDVKGTVEVSDGMEETTGELRIIVDKEKASKYNLTVAQVYQEIAKGLQTGSSATTLSTDVNEYDVYVVDAKKHSATRDEIRNMKLTVSQQDGSEKKVALKDIVSFEEAEGLQAINRTSQKRYLQVTAQIEEGDNIGLVSNRVKTALEDYKVPEGYHVEMAGEDETIMEAMKELLKMLGLAIVFIYLVMVAQFQSLRSPFIIMFTIPLAFTGGFFGLYLTGAPVSIIAMIGFVMLSGVIVNNGIVFVDYANQLIDRGMEMKEALVQTGKTRLRPIVMTALTTILGLSTMAIGMGQGADMVQPMAVVTIGGLLYGTLLTLFVVPCIYALFNRRNKKWLKEQ